MYHPGILEGIQDRLGQVVDIWDGRVVLHGACDVDRVLPVEDPGWTQPIEHQFELDRPLVGMHGRLWPEVRLECSLPSAYPGMVREYLNPCSPLRYARPGLRLGLSCHEHGYHLLASIIMRL